ncbi:hypothetical protein ACIQNI_15510 [Streptomyces sp. NPDC091266]|uniref:hypothetical protein n=1 Tax=Streptomyces sp. NPDC091266 TaxID=3365978 RepID=UPI00380F31AF
MHWHLVGLFYRVDLQSGAPQITENDGSAAAVRWMPLSDLTDSMLSPAAIDGLDMIGRP